MFDNPSIVSDSLQNAWRQASPEICSRLTAEMRRPGFAAGQTLRDIVCVLGQQVALDVKPASPNALQGTLSVSGYVEATSTTPDIIWGVGLDRGADPRFALAVTAKVDMVIQAQSNREHTLYVPKATFTLGSAVLDPRNFSGKVLEFITDDLIPFFGGPNFKQMAQNVINGVSVDLAGRMNTALAPVNAQLAGPSDAVRVGVSAQPGAIRVTFAPREITPPANGRMSGIVRWDPQTFTPRDGCSSFAIEAEVQTGPRQSDGTAPTRRVGVFSINPAGPAACAFTLNGLAAGWPNTLASEVTGGNAKPGSHDSTYIRYVLDGVGWDAARVVPRPDASAREFRVARLDLQFKLPRQYQRLDQIGQHGDPKFDPGKIVRRPRQDVIINTRTTSGSMRNVDVVRLNPQPLPPEPPEKGIGLDGQSMRLRQLKHGNQAKPGAAVGVNAGKSIVGKPQTAAPVVAKPTAHDLKP